MSGINPSTGVGDTTLTVGYTLNNIAARHPATVAATSLIFKYLTGPTLTQTTIPSGQYGYAYNATYQVYTSPGGQPLGAWSGITTSESVSVTSGSGADLNTSDGSTNTSGQFVDYLAVYQGAPLPPDFSLTISQDLAVGGIFVRNNTVVFTATPPPTVTSNGPSS
jgi:hypothetical protein